MRVPDAHDELLDHEYDGIREYDNPTPGWWHLLFFATVVFAIPYVLIWHFSIFGPSPEEAYESDVAAFYQQQFAKFGDLKPTAETIGGLAANENYMNAIAGTFQTNCANCHGKQGQGLVGPNLTDDHYKNLEGVEGIYDVITNGAANNAMPSWERQLREVERILLSAYVVSLRGRDVPAGRPPEGEEVPPFPGFEPLSFEEEAPAEG